MSDAPRNLIKKHFFYEVPHCGDYLSACKICHEKAWLIDDIRHKRNCEVGGALKELENIRGKNEKRS